MKLTMGNNVDGQYLNNEIRNTKISALWSYSSEVWLYLLHNKKYIHSFGIKKYSERNQS
jgi:hypothetical protein